MLKKVIYVCGDRYLEHVCKVVGCSGKCGKRSIGVKFVAAFAGAPMIYEMHSVQKISFALASKKVEREERREEREEILASAQRTLWHSPSNGRLTYSAWLFQYEDLTVNSRKKPWHICLVKIP